MSRYEKIITMKFPDKQYYRPEFMPWQGYGEFGVYLKVVRDSLAGHEKLYYLYSFFLQSSAVLGDVVECGVYRGGTASLLVNLMRDKCKNKKLHLFDTFNGIPNCNPELDAHQTGDFGDTTLETVKDAVGNENLVVYHVGTIPDTFGGCDTMVVSFVHIDVDVHKAYVDCLEFFWQRLSVGGVMVLDDYGHPNTTGARKATDDFFADKKEKPITLLKGQAVIIKISS